MARFEKGDKVEVVTSFNGFYRRKGIVVDVLDSSFHTITRRKLRKVLVLLEGEAVPIEMLTESLTRQKERNY